MAAIENVRRAGVTILAVAMTVGLAWFGWSAYAESQRRQSVATALTLADRGRFTEALPALERAATAWSGLVDDPERTRVLLTLGKCQSAAGYYEAAVASWTRIAPRSRDAAKATALIAETARATQRWILTEAIHKSTLAGRGPDIDTARDDVIFLYRCQGRIAEARELHLAALPSSDTPVKILKELWAFDYEPYPTDAVEKIVEEATRPGDEDPCLTLARAHLALRTRPEQAEALLNRVTDPRLALAVARMRLEFARLVGNPIAARQAVEQLQPADLDASDWIALLAWCAWREGDASRERDAWARLLAINPAHPEALERLADLLLRAGDVAPALELRKRKDARDAAQRRYENMLVFEEPDQTLKERALLCEALGRPRDARAWWTLVARAEPGSAEARESLLRLARESSFSVDRAVLRSDVLKALQRMAPPPLAAAATGDDSVAFEEAAERAGLLFKFENGQTPEHQLPETMSGGVALIDFDQDGWIDVYVVQGGPFPPPGETRNNDRLFRNLGDGTFQDVSTSTGIAGFVGGYGHGVTVGDVDRNGFSDLVVTRWRDVRLYLNRGDGTFADASEDWGLGHDAGWPTSAALADLDGDGDLDLYVCEYCEWDTAHPRVCRGTDGIQSNYCPPSLLPALPDRLFRNEGNRFVDVSKFSGIAAADAEGRGLGVVAADLDGDRRLDLFVANDTTANFFFRNLGDMHFEECALARGLASNAEGGYLAGMGVACGDFDADGRTDLAVTNYYGECTTYYRNLGEGLFADRTAEIGLSAPTRDRLGFGVYFSDMNNDGLLDIVQVNGHAGDFRPAYPYAMPAQLLLQRGDGRVAEPRPRTGDPWRVLRVGRGLAIGDLDNDGMLDALIVDQLGPLSYLHNRTTHVQRHSVSVELRGTRSGLDAVGAVVTVTCSGRQQSFQRLGGGSYQSASDTRLHFGLAGASTIDSLEVRWPAGTKAIYHNLEPDTRYRVTEGAAAPEKLGPLVSSQSR